MQLSAGDPSPRQPSGAGGSRADARPSTLASADFDGDGMPDLAVGDAGPDAGAVVLHRGNVDALFPNAPEAQRRRSAGTMLEAAFLPDPRRVDLPFAVDFLGAGDFDNDGHPDLIAATKGGTSLHVLKGDGMGRLSPAMDIDLVGRLGAMAVGDINRVDGIPDVVVALTGEAGSMLVVLESPRGVVGARPETIRLPSPPTALLLGRVLGKAFIDIVASAGDDLFVVEGRDRRLLLDAPGESSAGEARVQRLPLPSSIESLAWGDFLGEPTPREELAVATRDGRLFFLDLEETGGTLALKPVDGEHPIAPGTTLLAARLSGHATQDLLILEPADRPLRVVSDLRRPDPQEAGESPQQARIVDLGTWSYPDLRGRTGAVLPMRLNVDARPDLVLLQEGQAVPTLSPTAAESIITVNTSGDGISPADGQCTLREAIDNANANTDTTGGDCAAGTGLDTIAFMIDGGGSTASIAPLSMLPAITDSVVIDGTTQGCPAPPCIELNGTSAGAAAVGLRLDAAMNTVRGLVINRFTSHGILGTTSGSFIEGNRIGTDMTGTVARGNGASGIQFDGTTAQANTIGGKVAAARNLVSANTGTGIVLNSGAANNQVLGNYIGTDAVGTVDLSTNQGIRLVGAPSNMVGGPDAGAGNLISGNNSFSLEVNAAPGNVVQGNLIGTDASGTMRLGNEFGVLLNAASNGCTIGGTSPGARNVISGSTLGYGVRIINNSNNNLVVGNYVGTDITGTSAIPNNWEGVSIWRSSSNTIGGLLPEARNVISGNLQYGFFVNWYGTGTTGGNTLLGNYIGVDVTGSVALGNGYSGVHVRSPSVTIGGAVPEARNVISGNAQDGVFLRLSGTIGNTILGNYIGVDATGATAIGNGWHGVEIENAPSNTVGGDAPEARNVISGNGRDGVFLSGATATGNTILGNYIGVDVTGTVAIGNGFNGVEMQTTSSNRVGGDTPGAGNVIAANILYNGVMIGASNGTVVQGNKIGTDAMGTTALGNGTTGVRAVNSYSCTIGGTGAGQGNLISGNATDGIELVNSGNNDVLGNYIGTDITGTSALPNGGVGVWVNQGNSNRIGGATPGAGNVISGNGVAGSAPGIQIEAGSTGNAIQGNLIGTSAQGTVAIGNAGPGVAFSIVGSNYLGGAEPGAGNVISGNIDSGVIINGSTGVMVQGNAIGSDATGTVAMGNGAMGVRVRDSVGTWVGGIEAGQGNRILGNGMSGVAVQGMSADNLILGNTIAGNSQLGIDLGEEDGVTANDPGDTDAGPNGLQNFPVLTSVVSSPSGAVVIDGSLDSTPLAAFRVEFLANESCDASGHGEGRRLLGSIDVATDESGMALFTAVLAAPLPAGEMVTATATSETGSTSEFSACVAASCSSTATFPDILFASDSERLSWAAPADVRWVKGDLSQVGGYATLGDGTLLGASGLDLSADQPAIGTGLYYLVRPLICGSWQTVLGDQPGRDQRLP